MRETASGRRQAPRHVTSSLDAARELGIRDAQAGVVRQFQVAQPPWQNIRVTQPGCYRGRHYTAYLEEVRSLRRASKLEEAERLLLNLIDAVEAESRAQRLGVAPWYYEQLAIVYRKQKNHVGEQEILGRFARQKHAPGVQPTKLLQRLRTGG